MTIPAFVNPESGSADGALAALERAGGFAVRQARAGELTDLLRQEVALGTPRVIVAGGDGTVATAAASLAGTPVAIAVLPGGTLNHFARNHGIPTEPGPALELATNGVVGRVDVAYVNEELFINTCSVGAYTRYIRTRERVEPVLGYWVASLVAGLRVLLTLRPIVVGLGTGSEAHRYVSPLVFVGVGERKLGIPGLGRPEPNGRRGLHVIVPRGRRQARRLVRRYQHLDDGPRAGPRPPGVDSALVDRLRVVLDGPSAEVALDGEVRRIRSPLEFRIAYGTLRVVTGGSGGVT